MSIPAVSVDEVIANASMRERSQPANIIDQDAVKSNTENADGDRPRRLESTASNRASKLHEEEESLTPKRSRVRRPIHTGNTRMLDHDFRREPAGELGRLWGPKEGMDQTEVMIKQPETRPTQEKLVAEIKLLYALLLMEEEEEDRKCVKKAKDSSIGESSPKLSDDHWHALLDLYHILLHEHEAMARQLALSAPKKQNFSSGSTDHVVEGSVNDIRTEASPDTGSDECIVSSHFASKLGKKPVPGTEKTITLANSKKVKSPGMIEVFWKFADDQTPHILKCWILPGSSNDFVLGSQFLKMTETLTKFSHRIKKVLLPHRHRLRLMGEEKERIMGLLNHRLTTALADTGSDLMLVSSEYVQLHGLIMNTGRKYRTEVELADGTRIWTRGTVRDATWTIGNNTVRCDFHVLDGLSADVILSKDYLFDLNIFCEYTDSFFNVDAIEDISLLCGIRLIEKEAFDLNELERDFPRTGTRTHLSALP